MDSFYPADESAGPSESGSQTATEPPEEAKGQDEPGQTTLVPSSIFPEGTPEPGQRCTFEVVHCYEKECELKYVQDEGGEEPGGARGQGYKGAESGAMAGSLGKLDSMSA